MIFCVLSLAQSVILPHSSSHFTMMPCPDLMPMFWFQPHPHTPYYSASKCVRFRWDMRHLHLSKPGASVCCLLQCSWFANHPIHLCCSNDIRWPLVHLRTYISPSHFANLLLLCSIGRFPHARACQWYHYLLCSRQLWLLCSNLKLKCVHLFMLWREYFFE